MSGLFPWKQLRISLSNNNYSKLSPVIFLFVFAAFFIPFVGPIFVLFLPWILLINAAVRGISVTAVVFFFSFLLSSLMAVWLGVNASVFSVFTIGAAGMIMAHATDKNYSVEKTIMYPSLLLVGAITFHFVYEAMALSVHPWNLVKDYVAVSVEEGVRFYSKMPLKTEDIEMISNNKQGIIDGVIGIFPAMVVMSSLFVVWMNFLLGKKYLGRLGIIHPRYVTLVLWKLPEKIIWVFIVSGALLFVPQKAIVFLSINLLLVICFLYMLQGLAIVSFLFRLKKVPLFFRYLFYFLIAVQQILVIPIIAVGVFDIWIDFRKLFQKNKTED